MKFINIETGVTYSVVTPSLIDVFSKNPIYKKVVDLGESEVIELDEEKIESIEPVMEVPKGETIIEEVKIRKRKK